MMSFTLLEGLAAAAPPETSAWLGFFGKLHPGIVHFPIALLSVAALLETWQILKKRREPAGGTLILTALAAASSVSASLFGWFLEEYEGVGGTTFDLHKWIGLTATLVAVIGSILALRARTRWDALVALRIALIVGSGLVLATGYLGGELVFGKNHIFSVFHKKETSKVPVDNEAPKDPLLTPAGKVDFAKDIAPMIQAACFKCHGGEKVKGKFKLNTKKDAFEGGESGKAILPGKPAISKFFTSLTDPDEDILMPPPKEKVRPTKEQIEKVRKWIEQGADWPDAFEFKK